MLVRYFYVYEYFTVWFKDLDIKEKGRKVFGFC